MSSLAVGKGECHSVQIRWVKYAVLTFLPCKKNGKQTEQLNHTCVYIWFFCGVVLVIGQVSAEECPFTN